MYRGESITRKTCGVREWLSYKQNLTICRSLSEPNHQKIKSYVKDTTHFLNLIKNVKVDSETVLLVTLDVVALYPNIPNKEGIEAARQALEISRRDIDVKPSNNSLLKLIRLVLSRNNFQFNGEHYLQIRGTAIGTKMAVGFANNYVAFFEKLYVYLYKIQPSLWLIFIDDVFMIWNHGEEALLEFVPKFKGGIDKVHNDILEKRCDLFRHKSENSRWKIGNRPLLKTHRLT
jgi:hypothetical protein